MSEEIFGNIHSIESCGTVDGPGIRFVVFTQGCPMRCQYCHNPDTWEFKENNKMSVDEIIEQYEGVKEFCSGGVTVTGGEPMAQMEFVTELFKRLTEKGVNTALDTSGVLFNKDNTAKIDELMKYTSIVLLDIKHIDDEEHKKLTKHSNKNILEFAKYLSENGKKMWIRHVLVPGITLNDEYLIKTKEFVDTLKTVEKIEVLPYHTMGTVKYKNMGLEYPLENTQAPTKEEVRHAKIMLGVIKNVD